MRCLKRFILAGILTAPILLHAQREKLSLDDLDYVEKTWPDAKKTSTGIRYIVEREGQGDMPAPGNFVSVLYIGTLLQGGKEFDRGQDPKHPFTFRLGRHNVIDGWDQILQLMRPGEKRKVIIPAELAYGTHGAPPNIPSDAALVFEMELVGVKKDS